MPLLMTIVFLSVVFSAAFGLHFYLIGRLEILLLPSLQQHFGLNWSPSPAQFWATTALLSLGMCSYFVIGKLLSPRRFRWLAWASSIWMGLFALLLVWVAGFHVLERLLLFTGNTLPDSAGFVPVLASGGMTLIGLRNALRQPTLNQITLHPQRLPEALDGLRIVQLSDIHVGPTIGHSFLRDVVDRTLAQNPDLIVVTGDLVDGEVSLLAEDVAPLFDLHAPLGVYFITGNHEFISGADSWVDHVRKHGITV
ncbi:MAG: metallophosphoesterase, partial [Myxococcota bacterium]|nr:metallophosphoesterase [Myxococcota bacterium]